MENNIQKKRDPAIDIARGIAIFLVFLGHISLTPTAVRLWLQSFHIPLFFICSGLVFSIRKYSNSRDFLKAQIKSLLIPYFTLGISLYGLICIVSLIKSALNGSDVELSWQLKDVIISLLLGHRLHDRYFSLWFIVVLFIGRILFYYIVSAVKSRPHIYLLLSAVFTFAQWIVCKYVQGFYWSLDLVPACLAFLSAGYYLKTVPYSEKLYSRIFLPGLILLSILLAVLNFRVEGCAAGLYSCYLGNPVLYYFGALAGSWMVLNFAHYLRNNRLFEFFGKNSLVLYAYNNDFSIVLANALIQYLASRHQLLQDPITQWLFVVVISVSVGSLLAIMVDRYFPWFLGKRKEKN